MGNSTDLTGELKHAETFKVIAETEQLDKRYSLTRQRWEHYTRALEVAPVPLHIDLELTNVCDLECDFCETTVMRRRKGMMSMETFQKVVDEAQSIGVDSVKLNLWGESVLHKRLVDMIRYVKERSNLITQFNTNANRMFPDVSRGMIDAGLDRLTISVDGISKGVYEKLRVKGKFEQVVANIEALLAIRAERGAGLPHVTMQIIRTVENDHEVEGFVQYWQHKVDRVSVTNITTTSTESVLRYSVREERKGGRRPCEQVYQRLSVLWDGSVTVCCNDFEGHLVVGNVNQQSLKDLWHGEQLAALRARHKRLDFRDLVCDTCSDSFKFSMAAT